MKQYYMAGNWKMHKTINESVQLAASLKLALAGSKTKVMIAPAFTALAAVADVIKGSSILLGAQNMGPEEQGAHTGEVSPLMLKDIGVSVVILGHSERRHSYAETDSLINRKLLLALKHDLQPILCVGETLAERESGQLEAIIKVQVVEGLKGVTPAQIDRLVIAYEPVWAIGTGKTATPEDADSVHAYIRKLVSGLYGAAAARALCIQYGGSVKPENTAELMAKPNIDGALVGGASLNVESFASIVNFGL
ncbi:MAG: triose-phosphate isomerase [Spirochaetes bacterium GWD1_61_31]|nr:MAG: triose-phosphate isomerase [Spirochaetes bacterium GWB1_60_80]OHD29612.1 MAG: triose-phosphate isomerase [Spirochaetes bacterium GWC1_61_12]OHD37515.1 MAG: triose-phosphate isomerase [Spirochaetes bacterium GWD1_61_31]OHD41975.1 MAG: triose-phosphate isomerase [Spirochaetes bacterium GWE1_60_18]OHD61759.1 MAG: triose-phosphate isomerase [Spirochaetes bacterium GWF1_60_12]